MTNQTGTRQAVIAKAREFLDQRPLYLDTETTGMGDQDEIVEVCIVEHDGTVLLESLVKSSQPIPPQASRIHGITAAMVADAPAWHALWPDIREILANRPVGIYNAEFDLRLMRQTHRRAGLRWTAVGANAFCIMQLYAQYYGEWDRARRSYRWQSLGNAGRQCSIALPNRHRAREDALLARQVLQYIGALD
jgi:DNA polymerase III subunit epsilon